MRLVDSAVPVPSDNVFGKEEAEKAYSQATEQLLASVRQACGSAQGGNSSPVLRLVKEGIAHLRSRGVTKEGRSYLVVKTDLEENVDPVLRKLIERARKDAGVALPAELAGSIDNAGIEVEFCGTAETRGGRKRQKRVAPEVLARIWKGMFTHPELVSFQPFCGGYLKPGS